MIALIGNLSCDLFPGRAPRVGGGAYHGARALHRLRVPARIVTRCAADQRDILLPPLVRLGTPVRWVRGDSTPTFAFEFNGEQRTMQVEEIGDTWRPADFPPLPSTRWVHVAPLFRGEFPAETLAARARRRGRAPPVIGWAAATNSVSAGAIAMFLITLLWTPPHFSALALCRSGDYERVGVPMMPNVVGPVKTCRQIVA